jgi:hypothetical protein
MSSLTNSECIRTKRVGLVVLVLFLSGCGHAPMAYQLRRQGADPVLYPPTKIKPTTAASVVHVKLKNARAQTASVAGCDIDGDGMSLRWQGRTAVVSLREQSFYTSAYTPTYTSAADQSPNQAGSGTYVDPLVGMEKFHADLLDRQSKGCLRPDENTRLRRAIVENLPLPPTIAYFFDLGSYDITGYFDLTPDFRMLTTSPIYRPDAELTPDNLIGYETAHYVFVADPNPDATPLAAAHANRFAIAADSNSDRIRISLSRATEVINGNPAIEKRTLRNDLHFSQSPGYFRLLFMADDNAATVRITRAIMLSAPDQTRLAQAVASRQDSAENYCATLAVPGVTCTIFPRNFGVSPELRVRTNGQDFYIRVGGFLQEAIDRPHAESGPPKTLKVRRLFRGRLVPIKFDVNSDDILKLVLLPGDEITW